MKKSLLLCATLLLVGQGCIQGTQIDGTQDQQKAQRKAPSFSLQDYDGNTVSSADFAGKPHVVNAWAAWCVFCRQELVDFAKVQKEFPNIPIIAIDRAESLRLAKSYTDDLNVTDDLIFLLDPKDSFYRSINGFSMPETIFVDANGNIAFQKRGVMRISEIRERMNNLQ